MNDRSRRAGSKPLDDNDSYSVLVSVRLRPDQYRATAAASGGAVGPFIRELTGKALEATGQDRGAWSNQRSR